MSPIKLSQKMWLLLILPTVGIIILSVFLTMPKFKEIKRLDADIQKARSELAQTRSIANSKEQLIDAIGELKGSIDYYAMRIPSEKGMSWLLIELSKIARATGVKYSTITPLPIQKVDAYLKIPIKIEIQSSYHNLGRYLNMIETSKRFISVDNITITSTANPLKHQVTLLVSTFMLLP